MKPAGERTKILQTAVDIFKDAIRLNPGDPEYHYNMGYSLDKIASEGGTQGDREAGVAAFRKAAEMGHEGAKKMLTAKD
jgi:hypothetical protein